MHVNQAPIYETYKEPNTYITNSSDQKHEKGHRISHSSSYHKTYNLTIFCDLHCCQVRRVPNSGLSQNFVFLKPPSSLVNRRKK